MTRSVLEPPSLLRRWREAEGLTLDELSALSGISVPMLSLVERGKRRLSRRGKVQLARRLAVPLRALFEPEPFSDDVLEPAR